MEMHLFGDLYTSSGSKGLFQVAVDGELTGSKSTNHEETGAKTGVRTTDTELLGDLDETRGGTLTRSTLGLVDLGQHGISGLRDESSGETGNQTRAQVGNGLHAIRERLLGVRAEDGLGDLLEDDELGHGVRNPKEKCEPKVSPCPTKKTRPAIGPRLGVSNLLLEEDGTETSVESTDTLVLEHLGETTDEAVGVGRLRDETDTGSLKRAKSDIGEELGGGGRGEVDSSAVVGGSLVTEGVDALLLEELITAELEGTLEEVTGEGRADTSQESASALILNDLTETANQATVVGLGVELDTGLDAV